MSKGMFGRFAGAPRAARRATARKASRSAARIMGGSLWCTALSAGVVFLREIFCHKGHGGPLLRSSGHFPAFSILPPDDGRIFGRVLCRELLCVPLDTFAEAQGKIAEQNRLAERTGRGKVRKRGHSGTDGVKPFDIRAAARIARDVRRNGRSRCFIVHGLAFSRHTGNGLWRFGEVSGQGLGFEN